MNGLGYGRYTGLSGSSHSVKEFANTYKDKNSSTYAYLDIPQQGHHQHGSSRNSSRIDGAIFGNIQPGNQRPYSAGSQISNMSRNQKRFRSHDNFQHPLTKQVDQLLYEIPDFKFTKNALCQAPEFLKVFSDVRCIEGEKALFDCVLLGSPRPKVHWLFNNEKMAFDDVTLEDTAGMEYGFQDKPIEELTDSDICRCTIKNVRPYHYGVYTVLAENEAGRAITTATLFPISLTYQ